MSEQTLQLQFEAEEGNVTLNITNPALPVNPETVQAAMEQMIEHDQIDRSAGPLVSIIDARIVERSIEPLNLLEEEEEA
ncbi:DUF2922 domain-containing protein [Salsuginibacillus kocurii]|uniref:DUF2922 domain-containing protein n=1 Tax=Salsuginibacillus kocurii TaxID=427078 RepID=UPI00036A79E6|nr:DUF2922 domain-containing protein [Salsuginibacillus kocurii]